MASAGKALEFYRYIKSSEFIHDVLNCFENNFIRLNLSDSKIRSSTLPIAGPVPQSETKPGMFIEKR